MPSPDIFSTHSRRAILAAGIGLIAVLIFATVFVLAVLRAEALGRTEAHLGNLAKVLSEQLWQSVRAIEIIGDLTAEDAQGRQSGAARLPDEELTARMASRIAALPSVRMLAFIDAQGNPVLHSPAVPGRVANFADRDHFRAQASRRVEGLYIGEPVFGRLVPEWMNLFSRRVEDGQGRFQGIVAIGVRLPYFENLFRALRLGEGGHVHLLRADGVLLATYPHDEKALGRLFAGSELLKGVARRGAGLVDAVPRVVASERLTGYPLVIALSSTEEAVLAGWRRDAWRIGAGAAGTAAFVAVALFFLLRQVTVSTRLDQNLRESDLRLHGIIDSAMDAIITVDDRQRIVQFNASAERIFGCPAAQAIGRPLERFIPERFRSAHRAHVENFGRTGSTTRMMGARLSLHGLRADGDEFPIDASISQIEVDGRRYFTVILRDITRRKQAEEALERSYSELRELSAVMNEVREAERMRIARELHDELAQWLTALKMDVSWVASRLPRENVQLVEKTDKMKQVVDTTVASVRRIAADLRPVMLDDLGLVPAVEGMLHELSGRSDIVVGLDADPEALDYGEPLATSVYRMVQEALTNVVRHAEAGEVRVAMGVEGENLVVRVRDDGKGFDVEAVARRKSYGLIGIRERAQTLGGSARVARLERGTLVEITIPAARYRKRGGGA